MGEETNTLTLTDQMDPVRAAALATTLGLPNIPGVGDPLPPFFHQIYFWQVEPAHNLGRDGHPKRGGLIPDLDLPRRMWAGGKLDFLAPLRSGIESVKVTTLEKVVEKAGRTGPLAFVTLLHEVYQQGQVIVRERQDLVYRQDPRPDAPKPVAPEAPPDSVGAETRNFSSTLLFRYSALTMNGHRIHYDKAYARDAEGYPGLVVHGPLLAQYLMLKATRELGDLSSFRFRATAPVFHHETAVFCRDGERLWVRGPDGRLCMEAEASV